VPQCHCVHKSHMDWRGVEPGPLSEPSRGPFKAPLVTLRVSVVMEVTANDAWPDNMWVNQRCGYHDVLCSMSYFYRRSGYSYG